MEDKIGTIEPGKFADIIIIDGNPMDDMHFGYLPNFAVNLSLYS